jgi:hypothetical protein
LEDGRTISAIITIYVLFQFLDVCVHRACRPIGLFLLKEERRDEIRRD